jgi:hypothetical protein
VHSFLPFPPNFPRIPNILHKHHTESATQLFIFPKPLLILVLSSTGAIHVSSMSSKFTAVAAGVGGHVMSLWQLRGWISRCRGGGVDRRSCSAPA